MKGTQHLVLQLRRGTIVTLLLRGPQTFFRSHKSITVVRVVFARCTYCIRFAVNLVDSAPTQSISNLKSDSVNVLNSFV